jgi:hypothetical protein
LDPAASGQIGTCWSKDVPQNTRKHLTAAGLSVSSAPADWRLDDRVLSQNYHLRAIEDLHAMLKKHGDWMLLGSADEQKPAAKGTVEAWARSPKNPVKGWYGLKKGLRGRFGMYVPPVLASLGLAEVENNPRNNRMRAK